MATTSTELPGWKDLKTPVNHPKSTDDSVTRLFGALTTLRFTLTVLAIGSLATLYVGHVYATQDLLSDVQQMRKENMALHLQKNSVKGMYDRRTGPAVIYDRARSIGLVEGRETGEPIRLDR